MAQAGPDITPGLPVTRERLRRYLDGIALQPLGETCAAAFFALPRVERWRPRHFLIGEVGKLFDIGLVAYLLRNGSGFESQFDLVLDSLAAEKFDRQRFSELTAAAVATELRGVCRRIPESLTKTPDYEVAWDGEAVAMEVVTPQMKLAHENLQAFMGEVVDAAAPLADQPHVVVFFADASEHAERLEVIEALCAIQPGESREKQGRWRIFLLPPDRREAVTGDLSEFKPDWFNGPNFICNQVLLGLQGNSGAIAARSLVPLASYLDPLRRKAERSQRLGGLPFMIAMDCFQFPAAHERLVGELPVFFQTFKHVSGVLLFSPFFPLGVGTKSWTATVVRNDAAESPLPKSLTSIYRQRFDFEIGARVQPNKSDGGA